MKFTTNEVNLLADVLNGCGINIDMSEHYLPSMINDRGAIAGVLSTSAQAVEGNPYLSGLELTVHDGITLEQMDEKWEVDGTALLAKIRQLAPADREVIIRAIGRAWDDCNGPTWDTELKALVRKDWAARKTDLN